MPNAKVLKGWREALDTYTRVGKNRTVETVHQFKATMPNVDGSPIYIAADNEVAYEGLKRLHMHAIQ